ncbi:MAG: methyltransferase [Chloroflexota bacterium]
MVFIPELKLGLWNGWLFLAMYLVVFSLTMATFSESVRARLYDRSLWTQKQKTVAVIGKIFSLSNMILFLFSPLRFESPLFILGLILWTAGLFGLVAALITYSRTPLAEPVNSGIYKISRNPQIFTIWVIFAGICLMIGSSLSLLLFALSLFFLHTGVLAEEEACLRQYGERYQAYIDRVPRYFLAF